MPRLRHDDAMERYCRQVVYTHRKLQRQWLSGRNAEISARADAVVIEAGNVLYGHAPHLAKLITQRQGLVDWFDASITLTYTHRDDRALAYSLVRARHFNGVLLAQADIEDLVTDASRKFRDVLQATKSSHPSPGAGAGAGAGDDDQPVWRRHSRKLKKRLRKEAIEGLEATMAGAALATTLTLNPNDPTLLCAAAGALGNH